MKKMCVVLLSVLPALGFAQAPPGDILSTCPTTDLQKEMDSKQEVPYETSHSVSPDNIIVVDSQQALNTPLDIYAGKIIVDEPRVHEIGHFLTATKGGEVIPDTWVLKKIPGQNTPSCQRFYTFPNTLNARVKGSGQLNFFLDKTSQPRLFALAQREPIPDLYFSVRKKNLFILRHKNSEWENMSLTEFSEPTQTYWTDAENYLITMKIVPPAGNHP